MASTLDWSMLIGVALGIGSTGITGLVLLVRMENRLSTLERDRNNDLSWRQRVDEKLDAIARDVNRLMGASGIGAGP